MKHTPNFTPEMKIVFNAARAAVDVRAQLGDSAKDKVRFNQFGDLAMNADICAEDAMVGVLAKQGWPVKVIGEEVGSLELPGSGQQRLVVMDGLDGSDVWPDMGGSMIALFEHAESPCYGDVVAAAISLDSMHKIIVAGRDMGAFVVDDGAMSPFSLARRVHTLKGGLDCSGVYVDENGEYEGKLEPYFTTNRLVFGDPLREHKFAPERLGSSAWHYALLALGRASLVGEATRKKNLELAAAFRIVKEAGGFMIDVKTGKPIDNLRYGAYGQTTHQPFMAVANNTVLRQAQGIIQPPNVYPEQK